MTLPTIAGPRTLRDDDHRVLTDVLAATVERFPDRPALTADGATYTYRRLDTWSDAVAALLAELGVGRGDRVALRMPPGAAAIASMIGIMKAGAAYVPLEVRNPPSRNQYIVSDSAVTAFLGDPAECETGPVPVVPEERITRLLAEPPVAPPAGPGPDPRDTAYIIYTSGTTGRPKGVLVPHGAAATLFAAAQGPFAFDEYDSWLLFHSIAFDFSVWEIWGPLATGARLVVLPPGTSRSPEACMHFIADEGITVLSQTPTAFSAMTSIVLRDQFALPALRYVVFGGEKLTPETVRPWAKQFGLSSPVLVNMYGVTEAAVLSTFHAVSEDDLDTDTLSIGRLLSGSARVVTDTGREAAVGEQGELWLAGPQVADGYLGRPELTAERFPTHTDGIRYYRTGDLVVPRPDGTYGYVGRADLQVKLRGHRIELSDIEVAVQAHQDIADAVVWVHTFKPGDDRLVCAYIVAEGAEDPGTRPLRAHVKELLPSYMHPSSYRALPLPHLPRTVNGKVDRAAVARTWEEERNQTR
ncbi:amino acid adenylation domain-containing protein [Streptomyces antimicrobicus]|uniref:Amino acid adenylation domain-containing protein n=1 Tax=Streptomyces antimicrobicus TaxID=2883108 RepID=A0ABS8B7H2_9ACTN|nr:amino acid adenylation domain-containing protein [Streptomyces antimicrobicus]MCB5180576.1 amino acid adenylation domain-containing protein [Streptomyces antimicrobicus]